MLTIYQNSDERLIKKSVIRPNHLLLLIDPNEDEIRQMTRHFQLPAKFFIDALDQDERPRLERDEQGYLIVLNLPVKNPKAGEKHEPPYITQPLGVIHTDSNLILVSKSGHPIIDQLIAGECGEFQTEMKTRITLLLFKAVAKAYDDHLGYINDQAAQLQQKLRASYQNKELFSLIELSKSLVFFSTSLSALAILYRQMMQGKTFKIQEEDRKLLDTILIDIEQSAEVAEMRRESLSNLMDAYAAIVHNNLNTVLKALTAIAIVMIIPTMIGSIFSMNVALPNEDDPTTTIIVATIMAGMSLLLMVFFYFKRYIRLQ
ncbi:magnesium transporter CorA family protein [Ignatzschineria cameli]|uniref:Magnesium transporter CorA family protein n=1 Tax=Ignatzschineria cameli TaxID=2182793 RepID=A0A2U2ATI6_9GAMM|nr:magnesium transporter CorA family protein [Ignatzschineria cameli]PWD88049.1 magnesium transporter CorA family protein [Ignatzschineria cameli]PWD91081.1 magnesium transporter CorA family protein [Ignatzschineria cameli]PWD92723.1 magnesium transporter CorA family protein [Ignatzschineria cameli]PWD93743.1 magnesium transporter CorA family protein [Ignatzschineria cameli]